MLAYYLREAKYEARIDPVTLTLTLTLTLNLTLTLTLILPNPNPNPCNPNHRSIYIH